MVPLPKRKLSKGKRGRRRSHDALGVPKLVECSQCHQLTLPHRVCPNCGYYRGRQVIDVGDTAKAA
jgi:large subunit ribosomal protein L32